MKPSLRALLGAGLLSLVGLTSAAQSPYGTCTGELALATMALTCTPVNCPGGCFQMSVTANFGPAKICACDYIGPHPDCCALATDGVRYAAWGKCGGYCPAGIMCTTWPSDDGATVEAKCLGGGGGGDDDGE